MIKKTPLLVPVLSFVLIVLVLGFNGWMNIAILKKNHTESVVGNYVVVGGEAKRVIEYALKYGKSLDNFFGLPEILERIHEQAPQIENVRLIGANGRIIYARKAGDDDRPPGQAEFRDAAAGKSYIVLRQGAKVHIFLPLRDKDSNWLGSLEMVFDEAMAGIDAYLTVTVKGLLAVACGTLILLAAIFRLIKIFDEQGNIRRRRLLILLAVVLGGAQLVSAVINQEHFQEIYVAAVKKNTAITADIIAKDIERVVGLGVLYSQLPPLEPWLKHVTRSVPEIETVRIDTKATVTERPPAPPGGAGDNLRYEKLLKADTSGAATRLQLVLSQKYLDGRTRDMLLDTATMALISFFFMSEMLIFMSLLLRQRATWSGAGETATGAGVIRPLAFLFFMATDLSISIIPLHTKTMLESLGGLSAGAVIGLPISVEMLCAGISTLAAGAVIDRKGWRAPFFAGLLLLALGALMSGWAKTILPFIAARGVVGCGYGFGWMAMRGYVAGLNTPEAKARGFSALNAGIYAGSICACALGAMLAERLGYASVFFVAVFVLILVGLFAAYFVRQGGQAPEANAAGAGGGDWKVFIRDKAVLTLIFLVTIPSALCLTGFLNYFFPIYTNAMGLSGANVGRAFMIYGISIIYLGPVIGKYLAGGARNVQLMTGASCIGVMALLQFSLQGGVGAALAAIFLFGIADSIGLIAQNTYLLNLPATELLGRGKALAIFSMCKKMGQMSGPMVLAWGCGWGATQAGVGLVGLLSLGAVGAFVFCMRRTAR